MSIKSGGPTVLVVCDGLGQSTHEPAESNAVAQADTPTLDKIGWDKAVTKLKTSGPDVGLPDDGTGNSEVGHLNLGGGRAVAMVQNNIDNAIADDTLKENAAIKEAIDGAKEKGGTLHLTGLISDAGVHADVRHVIAVAKLAAEERIPVRFHAFTDGRDTASPKDAEKYIEQFEKEMSNAGFNDVKIATICGRGLAMDRNGDMNKTRAASKVIVSPDGDSLSVDSAKEAVDNSYAAQEQDAAAAKEQADKDGDTDFKEKVVSDEHIKPTVIGGYEGVKDGDAFIHMNFRPDRARQITTQIHQDCLDAGIELSAEVGIAPYSKEHTFLSTAFQPPKVPNHLGKVLADNGKTQLRLAESEKYAHVTYFFSGGEEKILTGEDRVLIPSHKLKDGETPDKYPRMKADEVTNELVKAIEVGRHDFIVCNYANADIVGHSGNLEATKQSVEAVDDGLAKAIEAIKKTGGNIIITADHGNAEKMLSESGEPFTAHTTEDVPCVILSYNKDKKVGEVQTSGSLKDIAPTVLSLMDVQQPKEMTGEALAAIKDSKLEASESRQFKKSDDYLAGKNVDFKPTHIDIQRPHVDVRRSI